MVSKSKKKRLLQERQLPDDQIQPSPSLPDTSSSSRLVTFQELKEELYRYINLAYSKNFFPNDTAHQLLISFIEPIPFSAANFKVLEVFKVLISQSPPGVPRTQELADSISKLFADIYPNIPFTDLFAKRAIQMNEVSNNPNALSKPARKITSSIGNELEDFEKQFNEFFAVPDMPVQTGISRDDFMKLMQNTQDNFFRRKITRPYWETWNRVILMQYPILDKFAQVLTSTYEYAFMNGNIDGSIEFSLQSFAAKYANSIGSDEPSLEKTLKTVESCMARLQMILRLSGGITRRVYEQHAEVMNLNMSLRKKITAYESYIKNLYATTISQTKSLKDQRIEISRLQVFADSGPTPSDKEASGEPWTQLTEEFKLSRDMKKTMENLCKVFDGREKVLMQSLRQKSIEAATATAVLQRYGKYKDNTTLIYAVILRFNHSLKTFQTKEFLNGMFDFHGRLTKKLKEIRARVAGDDGAAGNSAKALNLIISELTKFSVDLDRYTIERSAELKVLADELNWLSNLGVYSISNSEESDNANDEVDLDRGIKTLAPFAALKRRLELLQLAEAKPTRKNFPIYLRELIEVPYYKATEETQTPTDWQPQASENTTDSDAMLQVKIRKLEYELNLLEIHVGEAKTSPDEILLPRKRRDPNELESNLEKNQPIWRVWRKFERALDKLQDDHLEKWKEMQETHRIELNELRLEMQKAKEAMKPGEIKLAKKLEEAQAQHQKNVGEVERKHQKEKDEITDKYERQIKNLERQHRLHLGDLEEEHSCQLNKLVEEHESKLEDMQQQRQLSEQTMNQKLIEKEDRLRKYDEEWNQQFNEKNDQLRAYKEELKEKGDRLRESEEESNRKLKEKDERLKEYERELNRKLNEKDDRLGAYKDAMNRKLKEKDDQMREYEKESNRKLKEKGDQMKAVEKDLNRKLKEKDDQLKEYEKGLNHMLKEKDDRLREYEEELAILKSRQEQEKSASDKIIKDKLPAERGNSPELAIQEVENFVKNFKENQREFFGNDKSSPTQDTLGLSSSDNGMSNDDLNALLTVNKLLESKNASIREQSATIQSQKEFMRILSVQILDLLSDGLITVDDLNVPEIFFTLLKKFNDEANGKEVLSDYLGQDNDSEDELDEEDTESNTSDSDSSQGSERGFSYSAAIDAILSSPKEADELDAAESIDEESLDDLEGGEFYYNGVSNSPYKSDDKPAEPVANSAKKSHEIFNNGGARNGGLLKTVELNNGTVLKVPEKLMNLLRPLAKAGPNEAESREKLMKKETDKDTNNHFNPLPMTMLEHYLGLNQGQTLRIEEYVQALLSMEDPTHHICFDMKQGRNCPMRFDKEQGREAFVKALYPIVRLSFEEEASIPSAEFRPVFGPERPPSNQKHSQLSNGR